MPEQVTNLTGIEKGRAEFAYKYAYDAKGLGKEYKSYVKKLPMLIKTNGIGAAFAFIFSKKDEKWNRVGKNIFDWLKKDGKTINLEEVADFNALVAKTTTLNSTEYRRLTAEVLAFLNWLRRFADGLIEGE